MSKLIRPLLFWTLILCACASRPSLSAADIAPTTPTVAVLMPTFDGCGFIWTHKDMPELSPILDEAVKELEPNARAWASAFGEDCVYADGHSTFSAMETDFYIQWPAAELDAYESFGNTIVDVMKIVDAIPAELIIGPQPGFVEFSFTKSDNDYLIVRVPIDQYKSEAPGKSGEVLFRMFYSMP